MTTTTPRRAHLSRASRARVDRAPVTFDSTDAARNAAYRRLTAVILGLDVATLAQELRSVREGGTQLPIAA